jgi:hypothetical protein
LNISGIHESVQVQTAQARCGPGFQEVLPSAFSQSLLKKAVSFKAEQVFNYEQQKWIAGQPKQCGILMLAASRCGNLGLAPSAVTDATMPHLHSASASPVQGPDLIKGDVRVLHSVGDDARDHNLLLKGGALLSCDYNT